MKKIVLGCAVLLSVAVVLATKENKQHVRNTRHACAVTGISIASDTVPGRTDTMKRKKDTMMFAFANDTVPNRRDTTNPKKDTMMLAKY
jgi:hypothetical protein